LAQTALTSIDQTHRIAPTRIFALSIFGSASGRYGAAADLATNSKNRVKEDLRRVPFADASDA